MKDVIKKCIYIFVVLCTLTACNNTSKPQRSYSLDDPVDNNAMYIAVNSVTQKESIIIDGKTYIPQTKNIYLVFDVNMSYEPKMGFDFNSVTYSSNYAENGNYTLNKQLSQIASNLSDSEWKSFTSSTQKNILFIFEGPKTSPNMKLETFDLEDPFVIYKEDIIIE